MYDSLHKREHNTSAVMHCAVSHSTLSLGNCFMKIHSDGPRSLL